MLPAESASPAGGQHSSSEQRAMRHTTCRWAVMSAAAGGLGIYVSSTLGPHATAVTAVPCAVAAAVLLALLFCALVGYERR